MIIKRTIARAVLAAAVSVVLGIAAGGEAGPLTNADIINFAQANISPHLVVDKIRTSAANFDLSDAGVAALRQAGVSDAVLAAMRAAAGFSGGAGASGLAPLPGIGLPSRPQPTLEPPPALGEIPPSPFGNAESPFANFDSLPSMPAPLSVPSTPPAPGVPSVPALAAPASASVAAPPSVPSLTSTPSASAFSSVPSLTPIAPAAQEGALAPLATPAPAAAFSTPAAPAAVPSPLPPPAFSSPAAPVGAPAVAAGGDVERLRSELANIVSGRPEVRRTAVAWLVANQQQTLPALRNALGDRQPEIQAAAVYALGTMRDGQSLAEIRRLIASPSALVRANAAEVLAVMDDVEAVAAAERALVAGASPLDGHIRLVGHARLVRAAGALAAILSGDRNAENRAAAAWSLAEIGRAGAAAWPALENALLKDSDAAVRREAARAVAVFHDPGSAALLESACRRDPDVRKVTLQAMADYPETVEFLISVMNLGSDQIAADELEQARATLAKLTGQDFGLDGTGWSRWFVDNRSSLAASPPPASALSVTPPPPPAAATASRAGGRQIDVKAWGIVTDPAEIPMAPEVDATPNLRRAGIAGGAGSSFGGALPPPPSSDFVEGPMGSRPGSSLAGSGGLGDFGGWGGASTASPSPESAAPAPAGDGVRLPLPPGLMGASGAGTETPVYGGVASPGYVAPAAPAPSSAPMYGDPYGGGFSDPYGGYSGAPAPQPPTVGMHSSTSTVIVPTPAGAYGTPIADPAPVADPAAVSTYASSSRLSDEVHSKPYQATGDLVPEAAESVPLYTGRPESSPVVDAPIEVIAETPEPSAAGGDYGTIAFPGDTDTFGLGTYDEGDSSDGPPSLFGGMAMPPPPGGGVVLDETESYEDSYEYDDGDYDEYAEYEDYGDGDDYGEVEDLSSIPAFDDVVQARGDDDDSAGVVEIDETEDVEDPAPAMTITTERRRREPPPAASSAPAPTVTERPRAAPVIPPDASEKASKILSALADIETGGASTPAPAPAAPAVTSASTAPDWAVESAPDEYDGGVYLTEDELMDVDDVYPGGFVPPLPQDTAPSAPVGTAQEMPLLGEDISPLPIPSDLGSIDPEEEAPAPPARRRGR